MKKNWSRHLAAYLLMLTSTSAFADDQTNNALSNETGFFFGVGGSYNSVQLSLHIPNASGISNVYTDGTLVAQGEAGGVSNPDHQTGTTFAPIAQFGYFDHFSNSDWLWGAEFLYKYLGYTFSYGPFESYQSGAFTSVGTSDTFFGNEAFGSLQTQVNHDIGFLLFFGKSYQKNNFYLGAGPAVIEVSSNVYNAFGFADINGIHTSITGTPLNFSSSKWMWAGMAQLGMMHYFSPSCFLDLSYNYTITGRYSNSYEGPFTSSTTSDGEVYVTQGTFFLNDTQRVVIQAFTITLNKAF